MARKTRSEARRTGDYLEVAEHRAETAGPYLAGHCPNSRVEAFGGHMTFREYPERFNALLPEFPATTG